ncbi:MAG: DUF2207 domain-containing protein [Saprospiraceae bacterium]|nr:MAG: hypothetical protein UZ09_BCD002002659 [Bacteroidetes bacterium OLB9]MCO6463839.1 DUF2207 domain-containing protein [Saprospiraceae bacterium]MCZ2337121.1 DUF2207 domain-containing protein [Chitinophagales bacterium]
MKFQLRQFVTFLVLLLPWIVSAEYFTIKNYDVNIKVYGDKAMFDVKEVITVEFSELRHGIFRNIPYKYNIDGKIVEVKISDISVPGFGKKVYHEGDNVVIRIGDADTYVDGIQTYTIEYRVHKAFLFFDEHTEFYWNITGNEWPVNIEKVHFTIQMDKGLVMNEGDYAVSTGSYGATGKDATVSYYVGKFEGSSTRPFSPYEGMTFAAKLPFDYVARPSKWELLFEKYGKGGIGGILFLLLGGFFYRTWSKYGKEHPIVKMVHYLPPKELNPAEAGYLIDESADSVDILSLLPYWAQNGHITIKRIEKSWSKDDHELTKIKDLSDNAGPYERIVFDGLFAASNTVLISDLEQKFYTTMQTARKSLADHIKGMGVFYPISIKKQFYTYILSGFLLFIAILLGIILESAALGVFLGLAGALGFFFAHYMLKKNELGVDLYQKVQGFKMFVKAAEKDKIEFLLKENPDYFEKTLPYAMVFGYAKQWSRKFDGLLMEPPSWYIAGGTGPHYMFTPSEFGSSFDSSMHSIQSAFNTMPSSGGGGFSGGGGGFSGGGFGGGGGGSW